MTFNFKYINLIKKFVMKKVLFFLSLFLFTISLWISCGTTGKKEMTSKEYLFTHRKVDLSKPLGVEFIQQLNEKIYEAAINMTIKVYSNDSLNNELTHEELAERGATEELIQITPDPAFPDYTYDSIVKTPFTSSMIVGNQVSEKWSYNKSKNSFTGNLNAFSVTFKMSVEGIELPEHSLFWIDYKDLEKIVGKEDQDKINKVIYKLMVSRLSDY